MSEPFRRDAHFRLVATRIGVLSVVSVVVLGACFMPVPTSEAPCPCASGFVCCDAANVCVEAGLACPADAGGAVGPPDGGEPDAGAADGGARDAGTFNFIFVTSGTYSPGTFGDGDGGVPAADAICDVEARQLGLSGHFIALLSTSKVSVKDRVPSGVRGWIGAPNDHAPDTRDQPVLDRLGEPWFFNRLWLPGYGVDSTVVATGSTAWGTFAGPACDDWTSEYPSSSYRAGNTGRWFPGWADATVQPCDARARLYCLQIDRQSPVPKAPLTGAPRAFVTAGLYPSGGGLQAFDSACAAEAADAGLVGKFKAALATESAEPFSRVADNWGQFRRMDGVLLIWGDVTYVPWSPLQVTADVRLLVRDGGAWPDSPLLLPTDTTVWAGSVGGWAAGAGTTCGNWLSTTGTALVRDAADPVTDGGVRSCADVAHVDCLEAR